MNGDYTKVPLRRDERWTGARMQEGRVLLDHDWNLNRDAAARATSELAADAIGPAGVVAGSDAFKIGVTTAGTLDLTVEPGRMWVGGLAAFAPAPFAYSDQDQIAALPASGTVMAYLDVFEEHVQPAEDPLDLIDPALAPIDSAARTRVGYRVRVAPTHRELLRGGMGGRDDRRRVDRADDDHAHRRRDADRSRATRPATRSPRCPTGCSASRCSTAGPRRRRASPGRIEDGGTAIAIAAIAGDTVTLAPATVSLDVGDLVEVSWLARRADRAPHGALYAITAVAGAPGGDVLTLDRAVTAPATALGLCVRRWDGETVGAGSAQAAAFRGADLGVRFTAGAGDYQAGDWWGARLRSELGDGIEHRTDAEPDGIAHAFAPLALVDLDTRTVISDCRPTFTPLVDIDLDRGCCTVSVKPGDDLQAAADSAAAGRRRAVLRGRPLPARHAADDHQALADRAQRRRTRDAPAGRQARGGDRLRHLQRGRGAPPASRRRHRRARRRASRISRAP